MTIQQAPEGAPLTDAELERYEEVGVHFPIPVLDPAEVARFRAEVDELQELLGPEAPSAIFGQCHLNFAWAYDLVTHERVLDAVERVIGPDILVHSTTLFSKPPGRRYVSWHQDSFYWHLSRPRLVSAWIALAESTVENGCLRVIPGSHKRKLDHISVHHEDNMLGTGSTVVYDFDESTAIDVVLAPGEMSLHHADVVHGSNANRSDGPRIGYAIRYLAPEVSQKRGHHEVVLARGRDDYGHYEILPDPVRRSVREGLPFHREFSERLQRRNLDGLET